MAQCLERHAVSQALVAYARQTLAWIFSRFLGGSKQLKPPYKQDGEAQNAKIVFTLSGLGLTGFACKGRASSTVQMECPRNVPVESRSVPDGAYQLLWDGGSCHLF